MSDDNINGIYIFGEHIAHEEVQGMNLRGYIQLVKDAVGPNKINKGVFIRKEKFLENTTLFRCPICKNAITTCGLNSIVCLKGHCFDIARTGYLNFLQRTVKTEYDEELFSSRNIVSEKGFFDPMLRCIGDMIIKNLAEAGNRNVIILDAGCGEGSHLGKIINDLQSKSAGKVQGVGIDISKEGIIMASKAYSDIIWCVADLANLPLMNQRFDVIINILSPSNYEDFTRALRVDGILIKVVPASNYLKELRDIFYDVNKQDCSNHKVIDHYSRNFRVLDIQTVKYNKTVDRDELLHIMAMTPLSWRTTNERKVRARNAGINCITMDFTVIKGIKKGR